MSFRKFTPKYSENSLNEHRTGLASHSSPPDQSPDVDMYGNGDDEDARSDSTEDTRSDITDDDMEWLEPGSDSNYQWELVFQRLTDLANLNIRDLNSPRLDPEDLQQIEPWTPNEVIRWIRNNDFAVHHATVRAIVRDGQTMVITTPQPPVYAQQIRHQSPVDRQTGENRQLQLAPQGEDSDFDSDESVDEVEDIGGSYREGSRSNHPTRQVPRRGEAFEEDESSPSGWIVRFRRQLPDGSWYDQAEPLPYIDSDAVSIPTPTHESNSIIGGHPRAIPTFYYTDKGTWVNLDPTLENGGRFQRYYAVPPKKKAHAKAKASPVFIVRRFHRVTGEYLRQYKFGSNWNQWDRNVQSFDVNTTELCQYYNRWLQQVLEKGDHTYRKREGRECWKDWELTMLRQHFNDIIRDRGLIQAHRGPQWPVIADRINQARRARNPNAAHRNVNSVSSQAERHIYGPFESKMGIQEWRQLGSQIKKMLKENPDLAARFPDFLLKPKNCIPLDDVRDKQPGGYNETATKNKKDGISRIETLKSTQTKLVMGVEHGLFKVSDHFGGELVLRFFPRSARVPVPTGDQGVGVPDNDEVQPDDEVEPEDDEETAQSGKATKDAQEE